MGEPRMEALKDLGERPANSHLPEVVVFWDGHFGGDSFRTNLNVLYVGDHWHDKISSIIVVAGTWKFYKDENYGRECCQLGPGYYPDFGAIGCPNDEIDSFKAVAY